MEVFLDEIGDRELGLVLWLQSLGAWLEPPMRAAGALGSKTLFFVLLPLVFWCVHAGVGARVYLALMGASLVNGLLKAVAVGARPYWLNPAVTSMSPESTFGLPSGHTQSAMVVWGYLATRTRRRWSWPVAGIVIGGVGLSRIYLGAHFLSDVLAGLAVGAGLLWLVFRYESVFLRWWCQRTRAAQVGLALAASVLPGTLTAGWQALVQDGWTVPAEWTGTVPADAPGATLGHVLILGGGLFGAVVGLSTLAARGWYSARGSLVSRVIRYVLGMVGIALILVVTEMAVPDPGGTFGGLRDYARYTLVSLWGTLAAPELFLRAGLARRPARVRPRGATG